MKRRFLSVIIALAMVTALFSGCGGGTSSAESSAASEATSAASEIDSAAESTSDSGAPFDDVRLKMLICWNGGFKTAADQYNNEVATALREKTGVTVEFEGIMMSETEKLNLMFASGDMPDIINAPYWGGDAGETQVIKKAGVEGRLIDIKDMIPKYPNLADTYNEGVVSTKYIENDLDYSQFNGARYILPQEVPGDENGITNWQYGVFVRGDVTEALGIDPTTIKTSDQLYDFMEKARDYGFKDVNGNDCIVATTYHEGWDYSGYSMNFADKLVTDYRQLDDGTVTYYPLTESWVDRNLFIWKMVNNNILDKECFKQTDSQADEKVGNGTALFASAQYGVVINSTKLTGLYDSNPEMRYTWVGPLNYKDGSELKQLETYGRSGSPAIIFPTSCSNIDAALTWLDYVNSEEGARTIQYGIEGVTYELNADGQPRMNADLTERYAQDSESVKDELREMGIGYMMGRVICADKRMTWWGEKEAFEADAENEYQKEYKQIRTVERIKGYPIDGLATGFEQYNTVKEFAFEGTTQKDYTERAFFAGTEEEAKQILLDYQNYLLTQENGLFNDYLDWMSTLPSTRDDIIF